MPELPEVETVKETLKGQVMGQVIESVEIFAEKMIKGLSPAEFKSRLKGQSIRGFSRRGKYIIFHLDDYFLLSHLRMEGKYFYHQTEAEPGKHVHLIFRLGNGHDLWYDDVRKFGTFHLYEKQTDLEATPSFKVLGLEPFDEGFDAAYLQKKAYGRKKPIKSFLLDQATVTGLGNIYVDEVLFRASVHPLRMAGSLTEEESARIVDHTRKVLSRAIELKGTTIMTFSSSHGVSGSFQNELKVHTRKGEDCPECGTMIEKIKVGGRGTYFCQKCQREKS